MYQNLKISKYRWILKNITIFPLQQENDPYTFFGIISEIFFLISEFFSNLEPFNDICVQGCYFRASPTSVLVGEWVNSL